MDENRLERAAPKTPEARLSEIAGICEAFRIASLQPQVRASVELAHGHGEVDVAVLGQYKAGKSSFLNSLVGSEVLPVDVLPATAVITRLTYGERDRARVRYHSGSWEEIALAEVASYVTESQNPANEKQVETVDLELAALEPFRGIRFVDTPGLGSVHTHNTRASMDWLPRVGCALVAIGANQPFGEQDMRLLQEVSRQTPEIVVLLTKADLLTEEQLESVVEFTQFHAAQHAGRQHLVLPFSTRPGYGPRRQRVEEYLLQEIVGRHEELFTQILDHKVHVLTEACRAYLLLAQGAASAAAGARDELRLLLGHEQEGLRAIRQEIAVFSRDLQTRVRAASDERFQRFRGEILRRLRDSLRVEMAGWTGNLARRSERFQEWLEAALLEEMARASTHGSEFLGEFLLEAQSSLHRTVRGFQDRLRIAIEQALGITFEGARFHAEISAPRRPDVRIGNVFDTQVDLLWFLIPMGLLGPLFERHFLGLLPWEVEKHLSRLANQWADATDASIGNLVAQATDFVERELATVETLAASTVDERHAIREALDRLNAE